MAYTFILNDETVTNSHGVRIMNTGIDLARFTANPVLLDDHSNSTRSVLGKWSNMRIEGVHLKADAEFDQEDEAAKALEGKIKRGFVNACSMSVWVDRSAVFVDEDGTLVVGKSEIYEASIVAVPSNANSLKMYAKDTGELMDKESLQLAACTYEGFNNKEMNKLDLQLSISALGALGLNAQPSSQEQLSQKIDELSLRATTAENALQSEKEAHEKAKEALQLQADTQAQALIDNAKKEGKDLGEREAHLLKLAKQDYQFAADIIASIPTKINLSAMVNNTAGSSATTGAESREAWSYADWQERDPKGLELMFEKDKDKFNKLLKG